MASRKAEKEEKAEVAAREAADELANVNRERRIHEAGGGIREEPRCHDQAAGQEQRGTGIIGGIIKSVQGTLEHAKEAVTGKTHETAERSTETTEGAAEKAKEMKDSAAEKSKGVTDATAEKAKEAKDTAAEKAKQAKDTTVGKMEECKDYTADKAKEVKDTATGKAGEYTNYAAEKAKDTKDATAEKAKEYKDYAADKAKQAKDTTVDRAGEYKDYTAEKAKEEKDTTVGKLSEMKDSAAGAAKRATEYLTGMKDERQKVEETNEATKEKHQLDKDEARRRMQELKLQEERGKDEDRLRAEADRETAADRGQAGRSNIFSAIGNVKDANKDKLTMPTDIKNETEAARDLGDTKRPVERYVVDVEKTPAGEAASTFKDADQMTGQTTFNDVGRMDEEGVGVVRLVRAGDKVVHAKDEDGKRRA